MNQESRFLNQLVVEHQAILSVIKHFKKVILQLDSGFIDEKTNSLLSEIFNFLHLILEKTHHGKEEKILFPWILSKNLANQGGPQCGLFMQYRVEWKTTESILEKFNDILGAHLLPRLSDSTQKMLSENSFIGIPLEEHQAGASALLLFEGVFLNKKVKMSLPEIKKLILDYFDLMEMHIRKEDECMFIMVHENMTEKDDEDFCRKANEVEMQYGQKLIQEKLSWGTGLK